MDAKKLREFVEFAHRIAEEEAAWADWHNRVFGVDGKFQQLFATERERTEVVESGEFAQVEKISDALRVDKSIGEYTQPVTTASGKFLVRLPKSLHEALTAEARAEGVSLNQLVVSKLSISLRVAAQELVEKTNNSQLCTS